jgi:acyl-CoA thioesterase II
LNGANGGRGAYRVVTFRYSPWRARQGKLAGMNKQAPHEETVPPLEDLLNLEQLDLNLFRSRASQRNINGSLFGGQILGQSLRAAAMTVEGRKPHSLHGYFLLPGSLETPVIYDVELTRDGGSFSTRRVVARQRARTIFSMEVSFHREETGFQHETRLSVDVPEPEHLLSMQEIALRFADRLTPEAVQLMSRQLAIETRPVNFEDFYLRRAQSSRGLYWIRVLSAISEDALTQMAGLAYLSDWGLAPVATLKHVESGLNSVMIASLDHAMWFHHPCHLDDWLLVDADSPFASGGRGLLRAQIYDRQRKLVASVSQEALIRPLKVVKED